MRKARFVLLVGVLWCLTARPVTAQVMVGAVRSTDTVLDGVRYFATLVGRDDIAKQLEPFLDTLTGGKGLAGLDRRRSLGFYVQSVPLPGQQPAGAIFIPVSDDKDFLQLLLALNFQVNEPDANQVRALTLPTGQGAYLRFAHRHAFISNERSQLAGNLPNPDQFLTPEQQRHQLVISTRIREVPPAVRKKLVSLLRELTDKPLERKPQETEGQYQFRRFLTTLLRQQLVQAVEDIEEWTLSADLDTQTHRLLVNLELVFRAGSSTAAAVNRLHRSPSRFRVLQTESGSSLVLAYPVYGALRELLDKLAAMMEKGIADKPQEQQAILRKLYESILPTLKNDFHELAIFLHGPMPDEKLAPVVALRLREGRKLEAAFRELVKVLPEDARARIHLDAATSAGHTIHQIEVSPDDKNFARVFGDEKLAFLVTDDYLLLGAGTHAVTSLQQAVAKLGSEQIGPAGSLELSLRQLAALIRHNPDNKNFADALLKTFAGQHERRDRVHLVLEGKDNRLQVRLELPTLLVQAIVASTRQ